MKRIIAVILSMLFCGFVYAGDMVNPIGFKGMDKEKKAVISFIKDSVKKRYTSIGMDNATT